MILAVHAQPRAAATEITGWDGDVLKIRLRAPPVDGKANEALVQFLAKKLHIAPSLVSVVRGQAARHKFVQIPLTKDEITRRLSA